MNDTLFDVVDTVADKDRKYQHNTTKNIETKNKKKSVSRKTLYKSTPCDPEVTQLLATAITTATILTEYFCQIENPSPAELAFKDITSKLTSKLERYFALSESD